VDTSSRLLEPFIPGYIAFNEVTFAIPTCSPGSRGRYFSLGLSRRLLLYEDMLRLDSKIYKLLTDRTVTFNPSVPGYSLNLLSTSRANDLDALSFYHCCFATLSLSLPRHSIYVV